MAVAIKTLTNVNDVELFSLPDQENGACSIHYPASGSGTYVVEVANVAINGVVASTDWINIRVNDMAAGTSTLTMSAPGMYYFEYINFLTARIRKTVGTVATNIGVGIGSE